MSIMDIQLSEESMTAVAEHERISIAFKVDRVLDVLLKDSGLGGFSLLERTLDSPYVKDYDTVAGDAPTQWAKRFDLSNWGLIAAHSDRRRIGGAAMAFDTAGVTMLEGRNDLA